MYTSINENKTLNRPCIFTDLTGGKFSCFAMESIYLINILFIHHRETKKMKKSIQVYIGLSESEIFAIGWLPSLLVCCIMLFFFVVVVNAGNAHVYFFISFFFLSWHKSIGVVGVWGFICCSQESEQSFKTKYLHRRKFIQDENLRQQTNSKKTSHIFSSI